MRQYAYVIEPDLRIVAFKINQLYSDGLVVERLYEITRQAWKMDSHKHDPDYALPLLMC